MELVIYPIDIEKEAKSCLLGVVQQVCTRYLTITEASPNSLKISGTRILSAILPCLEEGVVCLGCLSRAFFFFFFCANEDKGACVAELRNPGFLYPRHGQGGRDPGQREDNMREQLVSVGCVLGKSLGKFWEWNLRLKTAAVLCERARARSKEIPSVLISSLTAGGSNPVPQPHLNFRKSWASCVISLILGFMICE